MRSSDQLSLSVNPVTPIGTSPSFGVAPRLRLASIFASPSAVTAVCLAISACYEFIEWWVAVAGGASADAFLGTQGDVWDTQWDMFTALVGAITAQILLARRHDRALAALHTR